MPLLFKRIPSRFSQVMLSKVCYSIEIDGKTIVLISTCLADIWLVNQNGVTSNLKQFDEEMQTIMTNSVFPVMGEFIYNAKNII